MSQPDKNNFLTKLARFVSNPTTNWGGLGSGDSVALGEQGRRLPSGAVLDPHELRQAQLHQRHRNRRIRKKEFAILRQIANAGGVVPPGVAHTNLSNVMLHAAPTMQAPRNATPKKSFPPTGIASGFDVDHINNIEQQMVRQWWDQEGGPGADVHEPAPTKTQLLIESKIGEDPYFAKKPAADAQKPQGQERERGRKPTNSLDQTADARPSGAAPAEPPLLQEIIASPAPEPQTVFTAPPQMPVTIPPVQESMRGATSFDGDEEDALLTGVIADEALAEDDDLPGDLSAPVGPSFKIPVVPGIATVEQLPDTLNEPAILFAQEQDQEVERQLQALVEADSGQQEPNAMLALLDFYRATRQESLFETACIELVQRFGRSAPQYYAADLGQATQILNSMGLYSVNVGEGEPSSWCCPVELDLSDVMLLRSLLLQQPEQVLLDWRPLQVILEDAIEPLLDQMRDLASRQTEVLMWGGEHLLQCCQEAIEAAKARGDAAYSLLWLLRLELVRIMYGQERFDDLALEYCVEMETSPPAWMRPHCRFIDADEAIGLLGEDEAASVYTPEQGQAGENAFLQLNLKHPLQWQRSLNGGIQPLLRAVEAECTDRLCVIDCLQLDRMDTMATTELLAWLVEQEIAQRQVQFANVHRLLAVFWRVMGITSKAQVNLRRD